VSVNTSRCIAAAALSLGALAAQAQGAAPDGRRTGIHVGGVFLGSGVPVEAGTPAPATAAHVAGNEYHVPNHLPGHPTAATLWPRIVYVPCKRVESQAGEVECAGYDVSPLRGEYVYLRPLIEPPPPPKPVEPPPRPVPRPAPQVPKKPMG
jgi:hypothetical protein